jgi:hypothetical protein
MSDFLQFRFTRLVIKHNVALGGTSCRLNSRDVRVILGDR